jgi:hypothetical protein
MCGLFYLGALRAAEEMAKILGHADKAAEYRAVFESGKRKYGELLWNGEFYGQILNTALWKERRGPISAETHPDSMLADTEPRHQYGPGCLADMLLGQWFARVVGLGDLLPPEQVKSALQAIHRYNFRRDLTHHATVQRVYALNDEAGLLLCTWPEGGRPKYPFPYADEVWTGIEYQVAAHLIYESLIEEGLAIVNGVRDRHDGAKRNPWDECECGHHYARAMSSWSLILALSGYHYDAGRQHLAFAPKINEDSFRGFFSAGSAWGTFSQERTGGDYRAALQVFWGELTLQALSLPLTPRTSVTVAVAQKPVEILLSEEQGINFVTPLLLSAGQTLEIQA